MPNGSLVINDVSTEDTGRYTCIAGNSCNIAHTSAELYVVGESDILHILQLLVRSHQICWIWYFLDGCPLQLQNLEWFYNLAHGINTCHAKFKVYFKPSGTTNCFNLHVHLKSFDFNDLLCHIFPMSPSTYFEFLLVIFWYASPTFYPQIPYGLKFFLYNYWIHFLFRLCKLQTLNLEV